MFVLYFLLSHCELITQQLLYVWAGKTPIVANLRYVLLPACLLRAARVPFVTSWVCILARRRIWHVDQSGSVTVPIDYSATLSYVNFLNHSEQVQYVAVVMKALPYPSLPLLKVRLGPRLPHCPTDCALCSLPVPCRTSCELLCLQSWFYRLSDRRLSDSQKMRPTRLLQMCDVRSVRVCNWPTHTVSG